MKVLYFTAFCVALLVVECSGLLQQHQWHFNRHSSYLPIQTPVYAQVPVTTYHQIHGTGYHQLPALGFNNGLQRPHVLDGSSPLFRPVSVPPRVIYHDVILQRPSQVRPEDHVLSSFANALAGTAPRTGYGYHGDEEQKTLKQSTAVEQNAAQFGQVKETKVSFTMTHSMNFHSTETIRSAGKELPVEVTPADSVKSLEPTRVVEVDDQPPAVVTAEAVPISSGTASQIVEAEKPAIVAEASDSVGESPDDKSTEVSPSEIVPPIIAPETSELPLDIAEADVVTELAELEVETPKPQTDATFDLKSVSAPAMDGAGGTIGATEEAPEVAAEAEKNEVLRRIGDSKAGVSMLKEESTDEEARV